MTNVLVVDVQQDQPFDRKLTTHLLKPVELEKGVTLEKLYELTTCSIVERVILGRLPNGNRLDIIIDEEGTFGQWTRGIKIKNDEGYEYTLFGNCVFVQCNSEGDWIGWDNQADMFIDVDKYISKLQLFEVADEKQ
jgi:hypothetical protein